MPYTRREKNTKGLTMTEPKLLTADERQSLRERIQCAADDGAATLAVWALKSLLADNAALQQQADAGAEALRVVAAIGCVSDGTILKSFGDGWTVFKMDGQKWHHGATLLAALEQAAKGTDHAN